MQVKLSKKEKKMFPVKRIEEDFKKWLNYNFKRLVRQFFAEEGYG